MLGVSSGESSRRSAPIQLGCCSCHCSTFFCFACTIIQVVLLAMTWHANREMKKEWPRIVHAGLLDSQITVLDTEIFMGPTHAFYPRRCSIIKQWEKVMHNMRDGIKAGVIPAYKHPGEPPAVTKKAHELQEMALIVLPTLRTTGTTTTTTTISTPTSVVRNIATGDAANTSDSEQNANSTVNRGTAPESPAGSASQRVATKGAPQAVPFGVSNGSVSSGSSISNLSALNASSNVSLVSVSNAGPAIHNSSHSLHLVEALELERGAHLQVTICGRERNLRGPQFWNRYTSMISLTNRIHDLTQNRFRSSNIEKIALNRDRVHRVVPIAFFMCFVVKYGMKIIDLIASGTSYRYVQLWDHSRTMADKVIESCLLHFVSIIFTLALQTTYCTLYLTFWRDDHFVMQYIPTIGLWLTGFWLLCMVAFLTVDRCRGFFIRAPEKFIYAFWSLVLVLFVVFFIPMICYSVSSVVFMLTVKTSGMLYEEEIFSENFVFYAERTTNCAIGFIIIAVFDSLNILFMDILDSE